MSKRREKRPLSRKEQRELDRLARLHESVERDFPDLPHIKAGDEGEPSLEEQFNNQNED
jgi:hypothetical protein